MSLHQTLMTQLRHFCHGDPTPKTWNGICSLYRKLADTGDAALALEYAEQHLAHWPDALRNVSRYGWRRLLEGEVPEDWLLARRLDMPRFNVPSLDLLLYGDNATHLRQIYLRNPMDDVDPESLFGRLCSSPLRTHLTHLTLGNIQVSDMTADALLAQPWPNLERLDLRSNARLHRGLIHLLDAAHLPKLRELALFSFPVIDAQALITQLAERGPPTLRSFDFRDGSMDNDRVLALVNSEQLELEMLRCPVNGLTDAALAYALRLQPDADPTRLYLVASTAADLKFQLATLDFDAVTYLRVLLKGDADDSARLLAAQEMPALVSFVAPNAGLRPPGIAALAQAPWLPQLRELDLSAFTLGDDGLATLLEALASHGNLTRLLLKRCGLGPQAVPLLRAHPLPKLAELDLRLNPSIPPVSMRPLIEDDAIPLLRFDLFEADTATRELALSYPAMVRGAIRTIRNKPAGEVVHLDNCDLSDREGARLVPTLVQMRSTEICLRNNDLGLQTLEALGGAALKPTFLMLDGNPRIDAACITALGQASFLSSLRSLGLGNCSLDDDALIALCRWTVAPTALRLDRNQFTQRGYGALLDAPWLDGGPYAPRKTIYLSSTPHDLVIRLRARNVSVHTW